MPFFSIVIPTKDRPECLKVALQSLEKQTFRDFEVIVSDNGCVKKDETNIVSSYSDLRLKYYKTPKVLGLSDSFEFAISKVSGEWLLVIGDKNIFYPDALKKLSEVVKNYNPDIVNFSCDWLSPFNPNKNVFLGILDKSSRTGSIDYVDKILAIKNHLTCKALVCDRRREWFLGSIYSGGCYNMNFVNKIKKMHESGRLFDGVVPDRYGAVEALCLADKVLFYDESLIIYDSCGRNTWDGRQGVNKSLTSIVDFINNSREGVNASLNLEISGVICSVNNIVASDFVNAVQNLSKHGYKLKEANIALDKVNLAAAVYEELEHNAKVDFSFINDQKQKLQAYISTFNDSELKAFESLCFEKSKVELVSAIKRKIFSLFGKVACGHGFIANIFINIIFVLKRIKHPNIMVVKAVEDLPIG